MKAREKSQRVHRGAPGIVALVLAAIASCGGSPTAIDGSCVAVVNVDGFFLTSESGAVPADSVGEEYLTIGRHTGCLDQGEPADPLGHGESNFLVVGTELHRVHGFGPTERLAYQIDTGEWLTVGTLAGWADVTLSVGDEVAIPGGVLRLGLAAIVADSRCPVDVTCAWAGDVEVEIGLTQGSGPTSAHRLHLNAEVGATSVEYGGYIVRLVSVAPVAQSTGVITPEEYRVRFSVQENG